MQPSDNGEESIIKIPEVTPTILSTIPRFLRDMLKKFVSSSDDEKKKVLISSNNLANDFILDRWGIRPSEKKQFRELFRLVRKECRRIFRHLLTKGKVEWSDIENRYFFGVYKEDEKRGDLILGFVLMIPECEWTLVE